MVSSTHTMTEINELGKVRIAHEVVGVIASLALRNIEGIYSIGGSISEGISEMFGKKKYNKGIQVKVEEDTVSISVNLDVEYGAKIPEISKASQEAIKEAVENMTGLLVSNVDIYIHRVRFLDEKDNK